ncbi:DNA polymerase epsilon catalytic subunit [Coemansia sp. RSA 2599]|nr:DNA polymerase epsilon catalytic subunit [Coemansia sp. RSA 2599]
MLIADGGEQSSSGQTSLLAASGAEGNVPVSTFQLLRSLLRGWCQEADERQNPFAAMMTEHFYRWLTRPSACLYDPALAYLVRSLMRKVFLQMKAECRKLGAKIVYASLDKLIVTTGKPTLPAAQASIAYISKAIVGKPLFENITLTPLQYWTFLLWMNASNYGGIVTQQAAAHSAASSDEADGVDAADSSDEPRIEMLWNMKEYLPPVVQNQFELTVAEYIYKLASFHAQLRAKNPHLAHAGSEEASGVGESIEDVGSDNEAGADKGSNAQGDAQGKPPQKTASAAASSSYAAKGAFYKKLIGQYFTRKLLDAIPRIREACSVSHRTDPNTLFPQLPGSKLYLPGSRAQPALEFIKYISTVFSLDTPAANFVRIMRRNLLALLEVGEFSEESQFVNPCERLVLPRVVCDFCNFCRDMDFCRDADLLPTQRASEPSPDGGAVLQLVAPEWLCLGCGSAYDRVRIEERLIEQLQSLVLAYQMQDLVCVKCRLMKQDNFSMQCTGCAGKYKTTMSADELRTQISVYMDVAAINRLTMLLDMTKWVQSSTAAMMSAVGANPSNKH